MNSREDAASDPDLARDGLDFSGRILKAIQEKNEESQRRSRPAPDLRVYCDQHLGTEMVLTRSFGLGAQYDFSEPKADVMVMDYWRCQEPACDRCYDASRGYFVYSRKMGSRIQDDKPGQRRCGQHPEGPAMYIGKVGHGRQLFCPFYKCGEQGEVIAEIVIDSQVSLPRAKPKTSNLEMQWAEEREVFESFVTAAGLVIDQGSIECGQPPRPDILCVCSGQSRWFELGQIVNEEVKKAADPKRSRSHGFSFSQESPLVRLVDRKLAKSKNYRTEGVPVDLLMWFDLTLGTVEHLERLVSNHRDKLGALLARGSFDRVWIFDRWTRRVIWSQAKA